MLVDRANVAPKLLHWYDRHHRTLPWRAAPGEAAPDPYRVWLSEVMLQQTTVAAVKSYFAAFTTRWPTVEALAAAPDAEVMSAWAGLGYYARARNLIACARAVVDEHGGRFPSEEAELRALPGLGAYTAAAIAAIAFGQRAVVVDANVERIVERLFAIAEPLPKGRTAIYAATASITPDDHAGDFAQAMMDLGSSLCAPRKPACALCPLSEECAAFRAGEPERYPVKAAKTAKPVRRGSIFWLEAADRVLLCRRPPKGMLGGMRALPTGPWGTEDPGLTDAPIAADWRFVGAGRHVFTHFALDHKVYAARMESQDIDGEWWPIAAIEQAGLPSLFARAAAIGLAARETA
ncbi:A/G-specific adenine glycosylase [Sphingomonas vulcanisoli]|uniref:Adenine DNA glycosylase n=1 Tax=Sphingomonas vulcanisoli TaxID=1658060 RepID=A0ABX0TRY1_9SPHN|nr:A/G-specific adenine glycosylase [Sphingomonas vulcanisoli]NIJ08267.1 A/G-specific adenine glycosylase [Sphingomonas vulcanisoli]